MEGRYFDFNATTPLSPEARNAWLGAAAKFWLNPSSPYRAAARVHVQLQSARDRMAALLETCPERLIFNSGATEGNNAVFRHWAETLSTDSWIGVSPTEHPSVLEAAKHYFKDRIKWLELTGNGKVSITALKKLLEDNSQLKAISAMAANNETGILNDWIVIAEICRLRGIQYHCDASQWIGKCSPKGLDRCDFVTGCAHKFGGPGGIGFSFLPETHTGFKSLLGGSQESEHRAGTENIAGILAMVAALGAVKPGASIGSDIFLAELKEKLSTFEVVGETAERLWNTVMLIPPEFENTRWIRMLEKRGFLVSSGSACASGKQGPSTVLAAMGLSPERMRRAIRISSGWDTSVDDWKQLAGAVADSYKELCTSAKNSGATVISI